MVRYQRTLRRGVYISGIGLHSGHHVKIHILPVFQPNHGIQFQRIDSGLGSHSRSGSWSSVRVAQQAKTQQGARTAVKNVARNNGSSENGDMGTELGTASSIANINPNPTIQKWKPIHASYTNVVPSQLCTVIGEEGLTSILGNHAILAWKQMHGLDSYGYKSSQDDQHQAPSNNRNNQDERGEERKRKANSSAAAAASLALSSSITNHATSIITAILQTNQWKTVNMVWTIEHLMAALHASNVDTALVQVDGPEVPILDGSAKGFMDAFTDNALDYDVKDRVKDDGWTGEAFDKRMKRVKVLRKVSVTGPRDGQYAELSPSEDTIQDELDMEVEIQFEPNSICEGNGTQRIVVKEARASFNAELSAARTFCIEKQIESLWKSGLARGGSTRNAVIFFNGKPVDNQPLRFPDEPVRHKALDVMGDLALAGYGVAGKYKGVQPSHALNVALLYRLFEDQNNYVID